MEGNKNEFEYTYSARQNEEVKKIREKYLPKEETKIEQLRRLDEETTKKGQAVSLSLGTISTLLLGAGLSCVTLWENTLFLPGILVGSIGILGISMAFPMYSRITQKERQRVAPEILRLTNELMNGQA